VVEHIIGRVKSMIAVLISWAKVKVRTRATVSRERQRARRPVAETAARYAVGEQAKSARRADVSTMKVALEAWQGRAVLRKRGDISVLASLGGIARVL
jgi:hypothetical protein